MFHLCLVQHLPLLLILTPTLRRGMHMYGTNMEIFI